MWYIVNKHNMFLQNLDISTCDWTIYIQYAEAFYYRHHAEKALQQLPAAYRRRNGVGVIFI